MYRKCIVTARVTEETLERVREYAEGSSVSEVMDRAFRVYDLIATMSMWGDCEPEELVEQLDKKFRSGEIVIREGEITFGTSARGL